MRVMILVVLALSLHSGCGAYSYCQNVTPAASASGPEVEGAPVVLAGNGRPTVLVRYAYGGKYGSEAQEEFPKLRSFYTSGAFASVVHQRGTEGFQAATDLTLDVRLSKDFDAHWYMAFGLLTATALPLPFADEYTLEVTAYDCSHRRIGEQMRTEKITTVAWLPFTPLSLLGWLTESRSSFDRAGKTKIVEAAVENMAAAVITELRGDGTLARAAERSADSTPKK